MKLDTVKLLPAAPAIGAKGTNAAPGSANHSAWLREMEKQELAAWFNHGPLPSPSDRQQSAVAPHGVAAAHGVLAARPVAASLPAADRAFVDRAQRDPAQEQAYAQEQPMTGPSEPSAPVEQAPPLEGDGAAVKAAMPGHSAAELLPNAIEGDVGPSGSFLHAVLKQLGLPGIAPALPENIRGIGFEAKTLQSPGPASTVAGPPPAVASLPGSAGAQRTGTAGSSSFGAELSREAAGPERSAGTSLRVGSEPSGPVRVHAVWSDQVVRVWIGTDQSAALSETQLAYAVQDLRRLLRQQGVTLAALTVNGETLVSPDQEDSVPERSGPLEQAPGTRLAHGRGAVRVSGQP